MPDSRVHKEEEEEEQDRGQRERGRGLKELELERPTWMERKASTNRSKSGIKRQRSEGSKVWAKSAVVSGAANQHWSPESRIVTVKEPASWLAETG